MSAQIEQVDPAFTNTRIGSYGLPTLEANGSAEGFTFSTTEASAGKLHVVLNSTEGVAVYVDFMQMPEGLDADTANQQALAMARDDVPSEGWTYGGGSYAFSGGSVEFIVDLTPGAWQLAASYQPDGGDEVMTLTPFTVTEGTRQPALPRSFPMSPSNCRMSPSASRPIPWPPVRRSGMSPTPASSHGRWCSSAPSVS